MDQESSREDLVSRLGSSVGTAMEVLADPKDFFARMPAGGELEGPGIFAAVMLVATGAIQALLSLVGLSPMGFFFSLLLTPIFGAIGLVIGAAILLFASRALGGEASFESSLRIAAYTSAIAPIHAVFSIVPYLPLLASAYGIYLAIVAVVAVHRVPEDRAWMVIGGIGALLLAFSLVSTIAASRAERKLEGWGTHLEKSAEELGKAAEQWQQEMEKAAERMKKDLEGKDDDR
ncbi:MAG: YIP1 family protein [Candidatus Binatia bacterium]